MATKTQQSRQLILDWITAGRLQPGCRLDSERDLARQMGVNHQTLRRALAELVKEGVIIKRPRVGTFVRGSQDVTSVAIVLPMWLSDDSQRQPMVGLTMEGLAQALPSPQYAMTMLFYRPEHFWEDAGQTILSRGIRGVMLWANHLLPTSQVRQLVNQGVHVLDWVRHPHLSGLGLPSFTADRAHILREMLDGLVERGHRRIRVVRYLQPQSPSWDVVLADAAQRAGLGDPQAMTLWLPNVSRLDYDVLEELFGSNRPTAVVAPDACVASEIFRRCYRRGVRIPDELSLAAMSDLTPEAHPVPLTAPDGVHWTREAARQAGEHLRILFEGGRPPAAQVRLYLPVQWKTSVQPLLASQTMVQGAAGAR